MPVLRIPYVSTLEAVFKVSVSVWVSFLSWSYVARPRQLQLNLISSAFCSQLILSYCVTRTIFSVGQTLTAVLFLWD